jgi:hypothetical protein
LLEQVETAPAANPGGAAPGVREADRRDARATYTPRRPEKSVLYRVVQQHVMTLFAEAEARSEYGLGYPAHVRREFSRFLGCGQYARGFARVKCADCGFERLLPFSCKGRSICPSCISRRMADTAAHLVDHVLPLAPYRQWTLSLPHDIRLLVIRNPDLLSRVLQLFLRTVFAYQRRRARQDGINNPMPGAVTMLQFWGSVLQLTPHAHSWLPDGVFHTGEDGQLRFHRLLPPSDEDVEVLLLRIEKRVRAAMADYEEEYPDDDDRVMATSQFEASKAPLYTIPLTDEERPYKPRCAFLNGFSLHADLECHQRDRRKLERLLRYGLRPPFAQKRLSLLPDGRVRLKLRKPFYTGQTDVLFDPVEFLRRMAAAVPRPMQNMTRYHGIFSANANHRENLKFLLPSASNLVLPTVQQKKKSTATPRYRNRWEDLLERVFGRGADCPKCHGRMELIQVVEDPRVIDVILIHLRLPTTLPTVAPARAPPGNELDLCFAQTVPDTEADWLD